MSAVTSIDLAHLRQWVGREQSFTEPLTPFPARALAGLLNQTVAPQEGDPLPLPWQWLYFLDAPMRSSLGVDGHPGRGGFLPPVPLPRRMWAAGKFEVKAPLVIGLPATRRSVVQSVEVKEGKAGPLVFVNVGHIYEQGGQVRQIEEQNIVYRDAPTEPTPLPPGELAPPGEWSESLLPDAQLLFRYSALTYNGHRIHYDRSYAVNEEFYPALVVHGPLLATLLLDALLRFQPKAHVRGFKFRAQRPAFDGRALHLHARVEGTQVRLCTADADGFIGMQASAELA